MEVFALPPVTFTALADLCIDAGVQAGLGGGTPTGGVYSGTGVTDDGNGMTYSFDPAAAAAGTHTLTYTFTDTNGCTNSASDDVEVFALPIVTFTALADLCIDAGLNFEGINQEVASGQWEFQLFAKGAKKAGDEIWIARYLLDRLTEQYGYYIDYHPKPLGKDLDWNGSGMHANFSNTVLRTCGSKETYEKICEAFRPVVKEHIAVYGEFNDQRLTGDHETAAITDFSYGVSDRGASIRIPIITVEKGWKGWLEDRRPASNGDPYKIAGRIIKTVKSANIS